MFEQKNCILCNVNTCEYNKSHNCLAKNVEICLDNSVIANRDGETKCKTFKCRTIK